MLLAVTLGGRQTKPFLSFQRFFQWDHCRERWYLTLKVQNIWISKGVHIFVCKVEHMLPLYIYLLKEMHKFFACTHVYGLCAWIFMTSNSILKAWSMCHETNFGWYCSLTLVRWLLQRAFRFVPPIRPGSKLKIVPKILKNKVCL